MVYHRSGDRRAAQPLGAAADAIADDTGRIFDHRVARRADFEWTLNQAHFVLEPEEPSGTLRIHLDTETPSFDTFLAEIDGGEKKPVVSGFKWRLHPGKNSLRVRPRNVTGREGIPSWIARE